MPKLYMDENSVVGVSCRDILENISTALCGFFKVSRSGDAERLIFVPFGSEPNNFVTSQKHTEISKGIRKTIKRVVVTNGSEEFTAGNDSGDVFDTLKISTEYASSSLASRIYDRVKDYTYEGWECSKCVLDYEFGPAEITSEFTFADGSVRVANYITKVLTTAGWIVTCGRNDVTENEFDYTGVLSRQINKRIADGEVLGNNTVVTRYQGIIHLGEKKTNEDGTVTQKLYCAKRSAIVLAAASV